MKFQKFQIGDLVGFSDYFLSYELEEFRNWCGVVVDDCGTINKLGYDYKVMWFLQNKILCNFYNDVHLMKIE